MNAMRSYAVLLCPVMLVACGAAGGRAPGPETPRPSPVAESPLTPNAPAPAAGTPSTSSAPAPAPAGGLPNGPATSAELVPPSPVEMKPPVPTALAPELAALGISPKSLPPIDKLDPKALRGVMKLIARSLGVKCADCHAEGDFAAPTPRKKIAAHMWNEFAARLEMDGGSPLFCDSCHQGRTELLDRRDKKALGAWMDQNFVAKLQRKDGQPHECETCHVDMEMKLLSKWSVL